jgi:hypothetical protein
VLAGFSRLISTPMVRLPGSSTEKNHEPLVASDASTPIHAIQGLTHPAPVSDVSGSSAYLNAFPMPTMHHNYSDRLEFPDMYIKPVNFFEQRV